MFHISDARDPQNNFIFLPLEVPGSSPGFLNFSLDFDGIDFGGPQQQFNVFLISLLKNMRVPFSSKNSLPVLDLPSLTTHALNKIQEQKTTTTEEKPWK